MPKCWDATMLVDSISYAYQSPTSHITLSAPSINTVFDAQPDSALPHV